MEWSNGITIFTSSSSCNLALNYWKLLDDVLKCFCASWWIQLDNLFCYSWNLNSIILMHKIAPVGFSRNSVWYSRNCSRECNAVWLIVCSTSLGGFCYCCWLFDWPVIGRIWSILLLIGWPYFPFLWFSLFWGCLWAGSKAEFVFPVFARVICGEILNLGG